MRSFEKASEHYISLLKHFPNCVDAKNELSRSLARLKEARLGHYDITFLYNESHNNNVRFFDLSEFAGPTKVADIPGKGKGIVATRDIEPGTLLMVAKAFSVVGFVCNASL